jgi:hypothetical protein
MMAYQILWEYSVKSIRNAFINQYGGNALPSTNKKKRLPEMEPQLKQEIINNIQQAPDGVGRLDARVTPRKGGNTVPGGLLASYSPLCVLRANTPCLPPQKTHSSREKLSEKENPSCFCVRTNSASSWWSHRPTKETNRSQDVYMEICVAVGSIAVHFHDLSTNLDTQTLKANKNERPKCSFSRRNGSQHGDRYTPGPDPLSKQANSGEQEKVEKGAKDLDLEMSGTPRNAFTSAHIDKLSNQVRDFAGHIQKLGFMPAVPTERVVKSFRSMYIPFLEHLHCKYSPSNSFSSPPGEKFTASDVDGEGLLQTARASITPASLSTTTDENVPGQKQRKKEWKVPLTAPCEACISADADTELSTLTNTDVYATGCIRIYAGAKFSIEVKSDLAVFWYEMRDAAAKQRPRGTVTSMDTQHSKAWVSSSELSFSSRYWEGSSEAEEKLASYLSTGGGSVAICQELTPLEETAKITNPHQLCPLFLHCGSQESSEKVAPEEQKNTTSFALGVKRKNDMRDSGDHAKAARSSKERGEGNDFSTSAHHDDNAENKDLYALYNNTENGAARDIFELDDTENVNEEEEEKESGDEDDDDDDDDDEDDPNRQEDFENDGSDDEYFSESSD